MRDYGKVHTGFWSSDTLKDLGDDAKFLALYLMTCSHGTISGVFRLPLGYAVEDLGWDLERLRNGFETLSNAGWLARDKTGWVWVRKWLKWNRPDNANQWKAVDKQVQQVPEGVCFRDELLAVMSPSNSDGTVSEPFPNPPVPDPVSVPASESLFPTIPLDDGTEYVVPTSLATELAAAYPKVDLVAQLAKARIWCVANPSQKKTRRGVSRFLNGWMERAAKDIAANTPAPPKQRRKEL